MIIDRDWIMATVNAINENLPFSEAAVLRNFEDIIDKETDDVQEVISRIQTTINEMIANRDSQIAMLNNTLVYKLSKISEYNAAIPKANEDYVVTLGDILARQRKLSKLQNHVDNTRNTLQEIEEGTGRRSSKRLNFAYDSDSSASSEDENEPAVHEEEVDQNGHEENQAPRLGMN